MGKKNKKAASAIKLPSGKTVTQDELRKMLNEFFSKHESSKMRYNQVPIDDLLKSLIKGGTAKYKNFDNYLFEKYKDRLKVIPKQKKRNAAEFNRLSANFTNRTADYDAGLERIKLLLSNFFMKHDPTIVDNPDTFNRLVEYTKKNGWDAVNAKLRNKYGDVIRVQSYDPINDAAIIDGGEEEGDDAGEKKFYFDLERLRDDLLAYADYVDEPNLAEEVENFMEWIQTIGMDGCDVRTKAMYGTSLSEFLKEEGRPPHVNRPPPSAKPKVPQRPGAKGRPFSEMAQKEVLAELRYFYENVVPPKARVKNLEKVCRRVIREGREKTNDVFLRHIGKILTPYEDIPEEYKVAVEQPAPAVEDDKPPPVPARNYGNPSSGVKSKASNAYPEINVSDLSERSFDAVDRSNGVVDMAKVKDFYELSHQEVKDEIASTIEKVKPQALGKLDALATKVRKKGRNDLNKQLYETYKVYVVPLKSNYRDAPVAPSKEKVEPLIGELRGQLTKTKKGLAKKVVKKEVDELLKKIVAFYSKHDVASLKKVDAIYRVANERGIVDFNKELKAIYGEDLNDVTPNNTIKDSKKVKLYSPEWEEENGAEKSGFFDMKSDKEVKQILDHAMSEKIDDLAIAARKLGRTGFTKKVKKMLNVNLELAEVPQKNTAVPATASFKGSAKGLYVAGVSQKPPPGLFPSKKVQAPVDPFALEDDLDEEEGSDIFNVTVVPKRQGTINLVEEFKKSME